MTATWSRRATLLGGIGAVGGLAACGGANASGERSPSAHASASTGTSAGSTPATSAPATSASPQGVPWRRLARHVPLVRPASSSYDRLRLTPNPRWDDVRPLAIARCATAAHVAATLAFARDHDVPIALRAGGHSYPGWSAGARRLVVDVRPMTALSWSGRSLTVGAGQTLAPTVAALAGRDRALPTGSCPTVGVTGLTLGGGVGVLTRAYGLTCDHLTSARVVLASGQVVTASTDEHPDLFWALRGGGGGHLGVVTDLTFATVAAPTVVSTYLTWPAARAAEVIPAWFDWMAGADARAWSTLKLLGGDAHDAGMSVGATVTWVGPAAGFETMLAPILATRPSGRYDHTRGYLAAMQAYAGSGAREAFAATSHVAYDAPGDRGPAAGGAAATIVAHASDVPAGLREAGISIDALGGRVGSLAPDATAFVHRKALATVQYTATWDSTGAPAARAARTARSYVSSFRSAMTPTWGEHAYVNYADASLADPGDAYFGDNWTRLRQVRGAYDPDGLFTQPQ